MDDFIKEQLGSSYTKRDIGKCAYGSLFNGIDKIITIDQSELNDYVGQWSFEIFLSKKILYVPNQVGQFGVILSATISNNQICPIDIGSAYKSFWPLESKKDLGMVLNNVIVPWLDEAAKPENLIDFYTSLIRKETIRNVSNVYGQIFQRKQSQLKDDVRGQFYKDIAEIYEYQKDYDLALSNLLAYKNWKVLSYKPVKAPIVKKIHEDTISIINHGIEKLTSLINSRTL